MYFILLFVLQNGKKVASVLPFLLKENLWKTKQGILQQNCSNIVSASYQCGSLGKSSVLLPVTARLKWKKCCQGPKSGWPKTLGATQQEAQGWVESDKWHAVGSTYDPSETEATCAALHATDDCRGSRRWESKPHSPPRCVQRIQPETSGGQTPFHSYWFLYKQVILSLFGTGATREKFELPKTIRIHKRGVRAAKTFHAGKVWK